MNHVVENENIICFDVDETLTLERDPVDREEEESSLFIQNPYDGIWYFRVPHLKHLEMLRQAKARGRFVIVWSGNGAQWARNVVEALDLHDHVDLVLTKPVAYVDDQPVQHWLQSRIFIGGSSK